MCGIIGAVTAGFPLKTGLLKGLAKLEYRGYDSAGYCYLDNNNQLCFEYTTEKISSLNINNHQADTFCAIAHTRWATHGSASIDNAHPHQSHQRIALVHNGIIENYQQIKSQLNDKMSIKWRSETDSEVAAHYIYYLVTHKKMSIIEALREITNTLEGSYALVVIDQSNPKYLYAVAKESPLLIGSAKDGYYIGSDSVALNHVCTQVYRIPSKTIWRLSKDDISNYDNCIITWKNLDAEEQNIETAGFKHHTLAEIYSQPHILSKLYQQYQRTQQDSINKLINKKPKSIIMLACGSSHYCAKIAKYWYEDCLQIPIYVELASEFRYRNPYIDPNSLVISLSQSGETLDTLSALRYIKQKAKNISCMAIGNQALSTLAQESDYFWPTQAGTEVGVATTKVFSAQLFCLQALLGILSSDKKQLQHWQTTPEQIQNILDKQESIARIAKQLVTQAQLIFLGRGPAYAIAEEACLKVQELAYIPCHAFAAGELKHGPIALIDNKTTCIILLTEDNYGEKLLANIAEIQARQGNILVIGSDKMISRIEKQQSISSILLPTNIATHTTSFLHIICIQLLAYHLANTKSCAIDKPRNLAKCVTVE